MWNEGTRSEILKQQKINIEIKPNKQNKNAKYNKNNTKIIKQWLQQERLTPRIDVARKEGSVCFLSDGSWE
jgi:hypothetical protein